MLVAILSDIHANLEAFQSVIDDMERRKPDKVICLGDLIGYGPDPDAVVNLVRRKGYTSILGNHEAALFEVKMRKWLNFQAEENSIQTEKLLSKENLEYCGGLQKSLVFEDALFVHGFPPDSVLGYVTSKTDKSIKSFLTNETRNLFFVGHTHDLQIITLEGIKITRGPFHKKELHIQKGNKYIINAGSVGQPRDGDNTAKYILWYTDLHLMESVHIPYDFKTTTRKIKERGFPDAYGYRLW